MAYRSRYSGQEIDERLGRTDRMNPTRTFRSIEPFLYEADYFGALDYGYAKKYFDSVRPLPYGCSSVRKGRWYGRNFDWHYDNGCTVVMRTDAMSDRHAVLGVCGGLEEFDRKVIESVGYDDLYRIMPFYLKDGVNDAGVFCNTNVVTADNGVNYATTPLIEKRHEISTRMIPRFVLDNFSSALEAIEYIRDYVSLYTTKEFVGYNYEIHFMVGDADATYVVEIVGGQLRYSEHSIMTNFYVDGVTFLPDGKVYTPADVEYGNLPSSLGILPNGCGLERHNALCDAYDGIDSVEAMREAMNGIMYTNAYDPAMQWCSEFVDASMGFTVDTPSSAFEPIFVIAVQKLAERGREDQEPKTWQTTHSSVYDLTAKTLNIVVQENTDCEHVFRFKEWYDAGEVDAIVGNLTSRIEQLENILSNE